jgi:hypothetical protein
VKVLQRLEMRSKVRKDRLREWDRSILSFFAVLNGQNLRVEIEALDAQV